LSLQAVLLVAAASSLPSSSKAAWVGRVDPPDAEEASTVSVVRAGVEPAVSCRWSAHAHRKVCLEEMVKGESRGKAETRPAAMQKKPPPQLPLGTEPTLLGFNAKGKAATVAQAGAAIARPRGDGGNTTRHKTNGMARAAARLENDSDADAGGNCTGIRRDATSALPNADAVSFAASHDISKVRAMV